MGMSIGEGNKVESLVLDKYGIFNNLTDKKFAIIESVKLAKTNDLEKTDIVDVLRGIRGVKFHAKDINEEFEIMNELKGKLISIVYRGNVYKDEVSIQIDSLNELPEQPQEIINMLYNKTDNTLVMNEEILKLLDCEQHTRDILAKTILPKLSYVIAGDEVATKGIYTKVLYYCTMSPLLDSAQAEVLTIGYSLFNFRKKDEYGDFIHVALNNADALKSKYTNRVKALILKLAGCNIKLDKSDEIILDVISLNEKIIK